MWGRDPKPLFFFLSSLTRSGATAPRAAPARRTTLPDRAGAHAEQLAHTPRLAHAPFPSIHFFALGNFSTQASPRTAPSPLRQGRGNSLAPRFSLVPLTRAHLKPQQPSPNWPLHQLGIFSPLLLLRCHVKGRRERGGEGGGRKEGRRVTTASSCRSRSTRSWSRTSREEGRPRARKNEAREHARARLHLAVVTEIYTNTDSTATSSSSPPRKPHRVLLLTLLTTQRSVPQRHATSPQRRAPSSAR
jgi:hypothetical protein